MKFYFSNTYWIYYGIGKLFGIIKAIINYFNWMIVAHISYYRYLIYLLHIVCNFMLSVCQSFLNVHSL